MFLNFFLIIFANKKDTEIRFVKDQISVIGFKDHLELTRFYSKPN